MAPVANEGAVLLAQDFEAEAPGRLPVRINPMHAMHFPQRINIKNFIAALIQQSQLPLGKPDQIRHG